MSFSLSLSGDVGDGPNAEGDEQTLVDDLKAVLSTHADKVSYASGSFQFSGSRDLVAEISAGQTASASPVTGTAAAAAPDAGSTAAPDAGTTTTDAGSVGQPDPTTTAAPDAGAATP